LFRKLEGVTIKMWLLFLISSQAIFLLMQTHSIPKIVKEAGGLMIFDVKPLGYSFTYAVEFLSRLSEEGYNVYLHVQLPLDFFFPLLNCMAGLFLFGLLIRFSHKFTGKSALTIHSSFSKIVLSLPLIAMICDYLENILIVMMLTYQSAVPKGIVYAGNAFTITKSMATSLYYSLAIIFFIVSCVSWIRKRRKKEPIRGTFRG
jgi:hypothetical protein